MKSLKINIIFLILICCFSCLILSQDKKNIENEFEKGDNLIEEFSSKEKNLVKKEKEEWEQGDEFLENIEEEKDTKFLEEDIVGPGDEDIVGPGEEDIVGPGDEDIVGPGDEDIVGPGDEDIVEPGDEDIAEPGDNISDEWEQGDNLLEQYGGDEDIAEEWEQGDEFIGEGSGEEWEEGDNFIEDEFGDIPEESFDEIEEGDDSLLDEIEKGSIDLSKEVIKFRIEDPFGYIRKKYISEDIQRIFKSTIFYRAQYFSHKISQDKRLFQHELTTRFEFTPQIGDFKLIFIPEINLDDNNYSGGFYSFKNIVDKGKKRSTVSLLEAYTKVAVGAFDFSLGKRIYSWGAAGGPNPTDLINPYDLLDPIEGYNINNTRKMGVWSFYSRYNFSQGKLFELSYIEAIFIPRFTRSRRPQSDSRWYFLTPGIPEAEDDYPANTFENSQFAIKGFTSIKGFDLSVSYYDGIGNFPLYRQEEEIIPFYDNIRVAGFDFVTTYNVFKIFFEGTHSWSKKRDNDDYFFIVFGTDFTFSTNFLREGDKVTGMVEFIFNKLKTRNSKNPDVITPSDDAGDRAIALLFKYTYSQTISLEYLTTVYFNEDYDWTSDFHQFKISYKAHGNLVLSLKSQLFNGRNTDSYGLYKNNDNLFFVVDYTF